MREFRIRVPDLKDGQRFLETAKERLGYASTTARQQTRELTARARHRLEEAETPRVHLLDARRLVRETNDKLTEAAEQLEEQHDLTAAELEGLGEAELEAYDGPIRDFVNLFDRMKNVELSELTIEEAPDFVRSFDIDVRDIDFSSIDALKTLTASGGAGAAAGLTAFGAVGALASASTGTAIGTLSGAAATNATLAWLGGGAVAAGGGGVAAGAVVLGGIVALPVLAIGGLVVHQKGRQALAEAHEDAAKAEVALEEMETAQTAAAAIQQRAQQISTLVDRLADLSRHRNAVLEHLVQRNIDYATYDEHDRHAVMLAASVAKTLRTVMDVPVIDDDGLVTATSRDAITAAKQLLTDAEDAPE